MKISTMAFAILAISTTPALTDETQDVALAETLINQIKTSLEADKRAFDRAVKALAETEEGRLHLAKCPARDKSYWGACMTDNDWSFSRAYQPLYDLFYEEELEALRAGEETTQDAGAE